MAKVVFERGNDDFHVTLNKEVFQYFTDRNIAYTGNAVLYFKTAFLLFSFIFLYVSLVFFTPTSALLSIFLCVLLGWTWAFIGFNISHDACHGSYSGNKTLNKIIGYSFDIMGVSSFFWRTKHNIVHHTFTNIDDVDADIIQTKLLRLAPSQQKWAVHKYQHLYCVLLYGVSYFSWIFLNDFEKYFREKVHKTDIKAFSSEERLIFWLSKINYTLFYLVVPLWFVGAKALVGLLIAGTACGVMLGMVFQLAHIVEKTEFEDATEGDLTVPNEWAKHQFRTTANFAVKNVWLTHIVGGLNFQVEHHIFPKISHVHYHGIQPIVQRVCERFGVEYRQYNTVASAVASHFMRMKELGSM